ncbi:hypothetical protein CLOSTMETH_03626 [[Clostridium] methylpentosum DSM 5476]|uniref:Uncharacterized protein n=1 Tax=[Clostridium] methylpentosum DSM 5476 TaxID=537013 RepID=C0EID2_9FIRM|nr:hypothetical protein CLOSTMETH_03626 [[Clostridium] methylpentosum DSM 5476]
MATEESMSAILSATPTTRIHFLFIFVLLSLCPQRAGAPNVVLSPFRLLNSLDFYRIKSIDTFHYRRYYHKVK